jgi:phosphatidylethanolamine/phosphatidyl-N-methylethanolamine N-methyltransferase
MNKKQFLQHFLKEKKTCGAMVPSSKFLAKKMTESIDFSKVNYLIELGPGTGIFTEELIAKMHKDAKLLVIELDNVFYQLLKERIRHPNVEIVLGSATDLPSLLEERNIEAVDVIISSLPLANFSTFLKTRILNICKTSLKSKTGKFIQFQYTLRSHILLKRIFSTVNVDFTAFNIPPALVYSCTVK